MFKRGSFLAVAVVAMVGVGSAAAEDSVQLCGDGQVEQMSTLVFDDESESWMARAPRTTRGIELTSAPGEKTSYDPFADLDEGMAGAVQWGTRPVLAAEIAS